MDAFEEMSLRSNGFKCGIRRHGSEENCIDIPGTSVRYQLASIGTMLRSEKGREQIKKDAEAFRKATQLNFS